MSRKTVSATTIIGTMIVNTSKDRLGKVDDFMVDFTTGEVAYLVMTHGGFMATTLADKKFVIPMDSISTRVGDKGEIQYVLDASNEFFDNAPGIDEENYPDLTAAEVRTRLSGHYGHLVANATRIREDELV